jgi:anti-sigma factor RsiW
MRCRNAQKLMEAAIDGELRPRRHEALERHVAACIPCGREMAATERILGALARLPMETPVSVALEQATLRQVRLAAASEAERGTRVSWRALVLPMAVLAVLVLAVGLVNYLDLGRVNSPLRSGSERVAKVAQPAPAMGLVASAQHQGQAGARHGATPPGEPPPELAARPDLFIDLPILRHIDKLEHFEAIDTTTLDDGQSPG